MASTSATTTIVGSGSSEKHGSVVEGSSCACCFADFESANYVEYQAKEGGEWFPGKMCPDCLGMMMGMKYEQYLTAVRTETCRRTLRRLVWVLGPPQNIMDQASMPTPDDGEVHKLWWDGEERSAALPNAPRGDDRQKVWEELKALMVTRFGEGWHTGDLTDAPGSASAPPTAATVVAPSS